MFAKLRREEVQIFFTKNLLNLLKLLLCLLFTPGIYLKAAEGWRQSEKTMKLKKMKIVAKRFAIRNIFANEDNEMISIGLDDGRLEKLLPRTKPMPKSKQQKEKPRSCWQLTAADAENPVPLSIEHILPLVKEVCLLASQNWEENFFALDTRCHCHKLDPCSSPLSFFFEMVIFPNEMQLT